MEQNQNNSFLEYLKRLSSDDNMTKNMSPEDTIKTIQILSGALVDVCEKTGMMANDLNTIKEKVEKQDMINDLIVRTVSETNEYIKTNELLKSYRMEINSEDTTQPNLCDSTAEYTEKILKITNDKPVSAKVFMRDTEHNCYTFDEDNNKQFVNDDNGTLAKHVLCSHGRKVLPPYSQENINMGNQSFKFDPSKYTTIVPINYQKHIDTDRTKTINTGYIIIQSDNALSDKETSHISEIVAESKIHFKSSYNETAVNDRFEKDALTKLNGLHKIPDIMSDQVAYAIDNNIPVSVAHIDGDDFKYWNNQWSHTTGDEVLIRIANSINKERRKDDIGHNASSADISDYNRRVDENQPGSIELYNNDNKKLIAIRTGGDEFMLIGIGYDEQAMTDVIKQSCIDLHKNPQILPDGSKKPIGISCGVYQLDENQCNHIREIRTLNETDKTKELLFREEFNKAKDIADEREIEGKRMGKGVIVNSKETIYIKNIVNENSQEYNGPDRRNQSETYKNAITDGFNPKPSASNYDNNIGITK